jgi:hypothetical protein
VAVLDDINAAVADPTLSTAEKGRRVANVRAAALLPQLQAMAGRTINLDGIRWTVHEAGAEDFPAPGGSFTMLRAVLSATGAGGKVLLARDDARNPFYWQNPPTSIPDGTTTDVPDPARPGVTIKRTNAREDVAEAARALLRGIDL